MEKKEKKLKDPSKCKHKDVERHDYCNCCGAEEGVCHDCDEAVARDTYKNKWELQ